VPCACYPCGGSWLAHGDLIDVRERAAAEAPSMAFTAMSALLLGSANCFSRAASCALTRHGSSRAFTRNSASRRSVSASFCATRICCSNLAGHRAALFGGGFGVALQRCGNAFACTRGWLHRPALHQSILDRLERHLRVCWYPSQSAEYGAAARRCELWFKTCEWNRTTWLSVKPLGRRRGAALAGGEF